MPNLEATSPHPREPAWYHLELLSFQAIPKDGWIPPSKAQPKTPAPTWSHATVAMPSSDGSPLQMGPKRPPPGSHSWGARRLSLDHHLLIVLGHHLVHVGLDLMRRDAFQLDPQRGVEHDELPLVVVETSHLGLILGEVLLDLLMDLPLSGAAMTEKSFSITSAAKSHRLRHATCLAPTCGYLPAYDAGPGPDLLDPLLVFSHHRRSVRVPRTTGHDALSPSETLRIQARMFALPFSSVAKHQLHVGAAKWHMLGRHGPQAWKFRRPFMGPLRLQAQSVLWTSTQTADIHSISICSNAQMVLHHNALRTGPPPWHNALCPDPPVPPRHNALRTDPPPRHDALRTGPPPWHNALRTRPPHDTRRCAQGPPMTQHVAHRPSHQNPKFQPQTFRLQNPLTPTLYSREIHIVKRSTSPNLNKGPLGYEPNTLATVPLWPWLDRKLQNQLQFFTLLLCFLQTRPRDTTRYAQARPRDTTRCAQARRRDTTRCAQTRPWHNALCTDPPPRHNALRAPDPPPRHDALRIGPPPWHNEAPPWPSLLWKEAPAQIWIKDL